MTFDLSMILILFEWFLVGFSGAVVPGAMLLIVITETVQKGWKSGELIIVGHSILEIGIIASLIFGLGILFTNPTFQILSPIIGGIVLILFGARTIQTKDQIVNFKQTDELIESTQTNSKINYKKGITMGIITSIANPYFLIWWLSIGWVYMNNLLPYLPFEGINILTSATLIFIFHIAADIVWYNIVIIGINKGMKFVNNNFYKKIIIVSSLFLLFLGLRFIIQGILLI